VAKNPLFLQRGVLTGDLPEPGIITGMGKATIISGSVRGLRLNAIVPSERIIHRVTNSEGIIKNA
jgi:hypothetical protein